MDYVKIQIREEIQGAIESWELRQADLHNLAKEADWDPEECPLSGSYAAGNFALGDEGSHMWRALALFGPSPTRCGFCGKEF
jgi:hypothetical protein